jgi:SAM-dependent methyltransferase
MQLGRDTIIAHSMDELTPLAHSIVELEENLARKNMDWSEEVFLKERIHHLRLAEAEQKGDTWSQKETAREIGETPANLSRDLQMAAALRANPELKNAPTKAAAVRQVAFQTAVQDKLANIQKQSGSTLESVGARLVTADMRDFARSLPENSVDLCFTDFPFGIDYKFDSHDANKYEDSQETLSDLHTDIIPQILRVTKPDGWLALMMGSTNFMLLKDLIETCCATHYEYFTVKWIQMENGQWVRTVSGKCPVSDGRPCGALKVEDPEWLWFRPNSRNPSMWPELHAQNQYEKFAVVNMGMGVMIKKGPPNVLMYDAVYSDRIHEMQRPHELCKEVISRLTLAGQRVLDLCFGSGSALAAAADLERDFIGCDINPKNRGPAIAFVTSHVKQR